jgi:hypothetical protein
MVIMIYYHAGSLLGVIDAAASTNDNGIAGSTSGSSRSVAGGGGNGSRSGGGGVSGCKAVLAMSHLFLIISALSYLRGAPARPSPIDLKVGS